LGPAGVGKGKNGKEKTEKERRKKKDGKRKTEKERPTLKIEGGAPSA
jgi:hypothetical protein